MKLLFVHDHFFQKYGDEVYSDKFPYEVFSRYLEKFDEVYVWGRVEVLPNKPEKSSIASGERVFFKFGDNISSLKSFFGYRKKIRAELEKQIDEVDAVAVRLPSEYGLMAADIALKNKKPWSVEVVGCVWDALWNYGGIKSKLYASVAYLRMKNTVRKARFALYVTSEFLQDRYPAKNGAVTTSISNVEISVSDYEVLNKRLSKIEQKNDKGFVLGTIGSLKTKYKGVQVGIKALHEILDKIPDVEFRVLGKGYTSPYKKLAKNLNVEENVYFDGSLPSGDPVMKWLDEIDIYIHPSLTEGLPRALIEAMSRGCPAVGSSVGGIPELIEQKYLHKPKDHKKLADDLLGLMRNNELMKRVATRNFQNSKQYSKSVLDNRRAVYLEKFVQFIKSRK